MKPQFALEQVHQAAREDRLLLARARCQDHLLAYLPTFLDCRRFAADVLLLLGEEDFAQVVEVGGVRYDEYGVRVPREIRERYGLEGRTTWYVKLTLQRRSAEEVVFLLSLHALERPLRRQGGTLKPEW